MEGEKKEQREREKKNNTHTTRRRESWGEKTYRLEPCKRRE